MDDGSASVEVIVHNISRAACDSLERTLSLWALSLRQEQQDVDAPGTQLLQGRLQLDVTRMVQDGVATWIDTLRPVSRAAPQPNTQEVHEVVHYERGTGELLGPPPVDPATLLPGGAAAAKRRQLAEASVGTWVDGAAVDGYGAGTPLQKRQRVSLGKCHNCGSYGHPLSECPQPIDQQRVSASTAEQRAGRSTPSQFGSLKQRYFESLAKMPTGPQADPGFKPGCITPGLAAALGMSSAAAPPPWLSRMVVLGVPPVYQELNEGAGEDEEDGGAAGQLLQFHLGSEDEGDAAAAAAGQHEAAGAADRAGAAAADGAGGGEQFSPLIAADGGVPDEAPQPGQGKPEQQQQQGQQANGQPAAADDPQQPKYVFPGLNAPPPAAGDIAWRFAMQSAAWMQGRS